MRVLVWVWKAAMIAAIGVSGLALLMIVVGIGLEATVAPQKAPAVTAAGRATEKPGQSAVGAPAPRPAAEKRPNLPPEEAAFINVVNEARQRYDKAANDMAKGGVRAARKTAICRALSQSRGIVSGWVGTIYSLSSNADGNGVVALTIGPEIYVKTWNNAFSDSGDHTLIPAGSALFETLAAMKVGDVVKFAGRFKASDIDCVKETSVTQEGAISAPEFLFRFSSAAAIN